ncbi:MAG: type IV pilin protein [Pseudomonadota bacterium]|nr:type IV pilin protein [Pseudomonadota bacterium]
MRDRKVRAQGALQRRVPGTRGSGISRRGSAGFTLIELMIVVAIIAVLTAIAYPAYTSYLLKTRRAAAEGCLSEYANYMERYYTTNLRYDKDGSPTPVTNPLGVTLTLDCASPQQTGDNYGYTVPTESATAYTVQAAPVAGSPQAKDTLCGTLTLDQKGTRNIVGGTGTVDQCW